LVRRPRLLFRRNIFVEISDRIALGLYVGRRPWNARRILIKQRIVVGDIMIAESGRRRNDRVMNRDP